MKGIGDVLRRALSGDGGKTRRAAVPPPDNARAIVLPRRTTSKRPISDDDAARYAHTFIVRGTGFRVDAFTALIVRRRARR